MSRVFPQFNKTTPCPICGTVEDKEAVLIPVKDTDDGGICEAKQVHLECLLANLEYYPSDSRLPATIIAMHFNEKEADGVKC